MVRRLTRHFGTGLMVVLPFALVIWVLYSIFRGLDGLVGPYLDKAFGFDIPGIGVLAVLLIVTGAGLLTRVYVSYKLLLMVEALFQKIPFVKSLYTMFKELVQNLLGKKRGFQRVVLVNWPDQRAQVIGFVTNEQPPKSLDPLGDRIVVYLPNAFQIAGITVLLDRNRVVECDLTVEEGFKFVLSGGLGQSNSASPLIMEDMTDVEL